ncbi:hypothetical protein HYC85_010017 [Camellia sinensis]|uniref:Uncharacterized protein n=1 Tax=Camellia sinensis TaxID=4442 RepID=A0A7J7HGU9_CAMSI|nr:hypothetical protein HYC85_010017 [Camellia sinensis]
MMKRQPRPRRRWVTKMNGKLRGLRLSRSRRVNWKAFSIVILPRKITDMYADIVSRMKMDDICPTIVFSGHGDFHFCPIPMLNARVPSLFIGTWLAFSDIVSDSLYCLGSEDPSK